MADRNKDRLLSPEEVLRAMIWLGVPTNVEEVVRFVLAAQTHSASGNDFKLGYRDFYSFIHQTASAATGLKTASKAGAAGGGALPDGAPPIRHGPSGEKVHGADDEVAAEMRLQNQVQQMRVDLKRELNKRRDARLAIKSKQEDTFEEMQALAGAQKGAKGGKAANPRFHAKEKKVLWEFNRQTLPRRGQPAAGPGVRSCGGEEQPVHGQVLPAARRRRVAAHRHGGRHAAPADRGQRWLIAAPPERLLPHRLLRSRFDAVEQRPVCALLRPAPRHGERCRLGRPARASRGRHAGHRAACLAHGPARAAERL